MINNTRQQIDLIDKALLQLFEQRMNMVKNIVHYKKKRGLTIEDNIREAHIIKQVCSDLIHKEYEPYAIEFFRSLMSISRQYQQDHIHTRR